MSLGNGDGHGRDQRGWKEWRREGGKEGDRQEPQDKEFVEWKLDAITQIRKKAEDDCSAEKK